MKRFALVGHPVSHSFSARYFNDKFLREGVDARYDLVDVANEADLRQFLIESDDLFGFNVTVPHKRTIAPLLDELSEEALAMRAVNCVVRTDRGWKGYNTDCHGFEMALQQLIPVDFSGRALIFGDGGSAQAVKYALDLRRITYQSITRNGERKFSQLHATQIREHHLLIQTTPVGMYPNVDDCLDIPFEAITSSHFVMDLIYNPEETAFLRRCRLMGAHTQNGMTMLHAQAEKAWDIWNR